MLMASRPVRVTSWVPLPGDLPDRRPIGRISAGQGAAVRVSVAYERDADSGTRAPLIIFGTILAGALYSLFALITILNSLALL